MYREELGWRNNKEFKFHQSGKDVIRSAILATKDCDYEVYGMILNKQKLINGKIKIPKRELTSLYVIKELLRKLHVDDASIIIDGAYGRKYITRARTYLRQELKMAGIQYNTIHFVDSKKNLLIQLADIAAGSIAKSLSGDMSDQEFIKLFGRKIRKIYKL